MADRPKISVLIPTYRYARFLPEAIDSVLEQEGAEFELLISDDASDDGSDEIIRRYAERDPRIRFRIHESNLGMVANWNWCLREARGEYAKFVFGDDRLMSRNALARLAGALDSEPRAVMACSARVILDENSRPLEVWDELGERGFHEGIDVIARIAGPDRNVVGEPSAVIFRRSAGARGFDPLWRQLVDQEMWFHLLQQGGLVYDPEPLCAFRQHEAQQTATNRALSVGAAESLLLTARYLELYRSALKLEEGSLALRRFLFRRIYYARKDYSRTDGLDEADAELMSHLGKRWYSLCWLIHRVTKPFVNFIRHWRKSPA